MYPNSTASKHEVKGETHKATIIVKGFQYPSPGN